MSCDPYDSLFTLHDALSNSTVQKDKITSFAKLACLSQICEDSVQLKPSSFTLLLPPVMYVDTLPQLATSSALLSMVDLDCVRLQAS